MGERPERSVLQRLASLCYRRRRRVVGVWAVALVGLGVLGQAYGATFQDEFELPGSESQEAFQVLEDEGFGTLAGFSGQIVFRAPEGVDAPPVRSAMEDLFGRVEDRVEDAEVTSPYGPAGDRLVSDDGTIAYARIDIGERPPSEVTEAADEIRRTVGDTEVPGARIELGGEMFFQEAEFSSERVGLAAAAIILLVAFGSVLAMGLPIVTALAGIGTGIALVALYGHLVTLPTFANQAVAMIGIGVGIDYALFIVTRYREGLRDGLDPEDATVHAVDTAGRAVLLAGTTVIIAVLGLVTVGLSLIQGLAAGISIGVLMTMTAALTLLPAVLGFVGRSIDRLGLPHRERTGEGGEGSLWFRWSRQLQRRPWPPLIIGVALLGVVTAPLFAIRLGFADAGNQPRSDTTRRAYDLLAEGFGPGANGPFLLVAELPGGEGGFEVVEQLRQELADTEGVAEVSPALPNDDGTAAVMQLIPASTPQAEETTDLVHRLRDDVIPDATRGTDVRVLVGGMQAAVIDFADYTASRMPWFVGAVLTLSFLLLMAVFRSLLVPLKAVIMNLLSVGAAYGATVAVFQWGWFGGVLDIEPGPIDAWAPMMMFAIVFGLSIDYEVFLLSRIREDYVRTGDNGTAVANGLALTARVITAAAAIMFCVFGSFVLGEERALRLFGFGLAVAIALDASVVRLVVVPATMELLGDRNWWLPRWISRLLPTVHVESRDAGAGAARAGDDARPGHVSAGAGDGARTGDAGAHGARSEDASAGAGRPSRDPASGDGRDAGDGDRRTGEPAPPRSRRGGG